MVRHSICYIHHFTTCNATRARPRAHTHTHTRKTRYTRTPIYIHSCHAYTQIYTNICTCRFMQVSQGVVLNCPLDRVPYTLHTHTHTHTRTRTYIRIRASRDTTHNSDTHTHIRSRATRDMTDNSNSNNASAQTLRTLVPAPQAHAGVWVVFPISF